MHEKLVRLIERIYDGSMVKFELEKLTTGWHKIYSGVRQGCPLSPLLFNIYVRELGKVISNGVVPNDTAYKRWSCHSGLKLLCKLCRTSLPPAMGARFTVFGHAGHAGAAAHKSG